MTKAKTVGRRRAQDGTVAVQHPAAVGRSLGYGGIAAFARVPVKMPKLGPAGYNSPADYRIVGQEVGRLDMVEKVTGSAVFGVDVTMPKMLIGSVEYPPVVARFRPKWTMPARGRCQGCSRRCGCRLRWR